MKKVILPIILFVLHTQYINAQNVAINSTGAAPAASAMLDIASTNSGLLVPRVALTAANVAGPVVSPATSLLVYNTATAGTIPNAVVPGFYYWDGTKWMSFGGSGGKDWSLTGNAGTAAASNFLGTTDAIDLVFRTNNAERMRIYSSGRTAINTLLTPIAILDVRHSSVTTLSDLGAIFGKNTNATGTGVNGAGQGAPENGLSAGSGGAFVGTGTGVFAQFTTSGVGQGMIIQDAYGTQWNVGHWTGTAYRKILGSGTVSTVVEDLNGKMVVMNCPESPENLFMDYGHGKLVNGVAKIAIDPILSKNIIVDDKHPLKVFIQLEGDCKGVFVSNKTKDGFEVHELQGGASNVEFSYSIVATHGDQSVVSPTGQVRVAKYDARWEKAPEIQKTVHQAEPVITK